MAEQLSLHRHAAPSFRLVVAIHDLDKKPVRELDEDQLFDFYLNGHYFHTDERTLQFFFQLLPESLRETKRVFQVVLAKRSKRLLEYHLLVIRALAIKALTPGVFTSEILRPEDDASPTARTYQIPV
jgi:hypothetical protein